MKKIEFEKSETIKNLARAFAGECQAGARYQFISQQAMACDLNYIGMLMKTLAKNEMAHAKRYYQMITQNGGKNIENIEITAGYPYHNGTLEENIQCAAADEKAEAETIYPAFAEVAEKEGFADVAQLFKLVASVETCHNMMLQTISDQLTKKMAYKKPKAIKWKCSNCGFEHTAKEAWQTCPLCQHPQGYVMLQLEE